MILSELRTYLQTHRRATLSDMALRFGSDPDALRGMLSKWISKGSVVKLLAAKPCGTCCKCDPLTMEIYEWRD